MFLCALRGNTPVRIVFRLMLHQAAQVGLQCTVGLYGCSTAAQGEVNVYVC